MIYVNDQEQPQERPGNNSLAQEKGQDSEVKVSTPGRNESKPGVGNDAESLRDSKTRLEAFMDYQQFNQGYHKEHGSDQKQRASDFIKITENKFKEVEAEVSQIKKIYDMKRLQAKEELH